MGQRPVFIRLGTTARYCAETEVHVFALAVAACVLLSFYPFLIVIVSLCKYVLRWPDAVNAIHYAVNDYMPGEMGQFVNRNLDVSVRSHGRLQFASMFLLLFTANGIFEPMEVALNRAWGAAKNRSYVKNQILSLGLILLCGGLVLGSFLLTALNQEFLKSILHLHFVPAWLAWTIFKVAAVPITILALFLIYWLLPNCKIPARGVMAPAIAVGLGLELLKYINILCWPFMTVKLNREYGPFYISAAIVILGFASAMMVLAGAHWAARKSELPDASGCETKAPPLHYLIPTKEKPMKNWEAIADGNGLGLPAEQLARIKTPLDALEEAFRPLIATIPHEIEPAIILSESAIHGGLIHDNLDSE